ncbi:hypothetical protein ACJEIK_28350 [Mycobacterium sp. SMC-16]|uniref:hypothetical protein n=1 Tax=Mycobacterium sp. SMC-16 TaxID=3385967 RepID=UPI00390CB9E5
MNSLVGWNGGFHPPACDFGSLVETDEEPAKCLVVDADQAVPDGADEQEELRAGEATDVDITLPDALNVVLASCVTRCA